MASERIPPYTNPHQAAESTTAPVDKSIVLVGLMGAGKSSVGRRLARRLQLPFVDADEAIEEAHDLSISEIFERFGEAYFRDGERRVIQRLIEDDQRQVIATGGGAFCAENTRRLILDEALSVWIDAEIDTLVARVSRRGGRPLLKDRDPKEVLSMLAKERNPYYRQADIRVVSDQLPPEKMVDRIIAAMKEQTTKHARAKKAAAGGKKQAGTD